MSNKKIKDLNDAKIHLKGDFLKLALGKAKPMRVIEEEEHVKSSGRDGWLKLRDIVKYCLAHKSDTEDCVSYIQSFTSKLCDMAPAYP